MSDKINRMAKEFEYLIEVVNRKAGAGFAISVTAKNAKEAYIKAKRNKSYKRSALSIGNDSDYEIINIKIVQSIGE